MNSISAIMKTFRHYYPQIRIIIPMMLIVFVLSQCMNETQQPEQTIAESPPEPELAGSESCRSCHRDIYDDHIHTAHFLTSDTANAGSVMGSFKPGQNTYSFNKSVVVAMEKKGDSLYQTEYFRDTLKKSFRFDIVIGSGAMGQSFLTWRDQRLFQLPITYFSAAKRWSNSPGFPDKVVFNRGITSRCLECHTSYAKTISTPDIDPETFDPAKIVYRIGCEKCHGSGVKHVAFHQANSKDSSAKFIVNPAHFTRQQNLDLCALCHGGRLEKTRPSFSFQPGDQLADFFRVDTLPPDPARVDVHGNQYGLLRSSKCFLQSETMTCGSCHDPHKKQRSQMAMFSKTCISCHNDANEKHCPLQKTIGPSIESNCVDCHMPLKESRAIAVLLPGRISPLAAKIRSHLIAIYPDETQKVMTMMKGMTK